MAFIGRLAALIAVGYLSFSLFYTLFKPLSVKRKKRTRSFLKAVKNRENEERLIYFKDIIAKKLSNRYLMSSIKREELEILIKRLNMTTGPEEILLKQILMSLCAAATSYVFMNINPIFGYVALLFIPLGWLFPVEELENRVAQKNKHIMDDFPSFYGMLYYQYTKSVHIYLADAIRDFLPNANPDMMEELNLMLDNIEYGEEYALKQFKKRVCLRHIIKFCDIMETRLKGYDNTSQMAYLKNELDTLRVTSMQEELFRREQKNARIQYLLLLILLVYIIIYYYFQMIDAVKMFS